MKYLLFITMSILLYMGYVAEVQCKFVSIKDNRFIDADGREIIFHGVNIEDKSKAHNYLSWHGSEEFAKMRQWGFNCIRLIIIWDSIEPKPGIYNDEYLAGIDKRIQWAKENGIYVLLDMHQDLFSAKFGGDGAPSWAVIDNGKPHVFNGSVWSMAYLTSPAVHAAFDNFWANKNASDGAGLQDHFAKAWQHVAKRYANEPTVIGYDLFNEPFPGSSIEESVYLKLEAVADILAIRQGDKTKGYEIMRKFMVSGDLTEYTNDMELFRAYADGGKSVSIEFEQTILGQFYNKVTKAIREVDQNHIVFLETHGFCNSGTASGVVPIIDSNGSRDPLQAFAPHAYDIVTDTKNVASASSERIELIFTKHAETANRLKMPVLLGEWGAYYGQFGTLPAAQAVVHQIEKNLFSDTYWSYSSADEIDNAQYFSVLSKPYPAIISGNLLQYESNLSNKSFTCTWNEDPNIFAPSRIYLPEEWFPKGYKVTLEPKDKEWSFEKIQSESLDGYLIIPPIGKFTKRALKVEALK